MQKQPKTILKSSKIPGEKDNKTLHFKVQKDADEYWGCDGSKEN